MSLMVTEIETRAALFNKIDELGKPGHLESFYRVARIAQMALSRGGLRIPCLFLACCPRG